MIKPEYVESLNLVKARLLEEASDYAQLVSTAQVEIDNLGIFLPDADADTKANVMLYVAQLLSDATFMEILSPGQVSFDYLSRISSAAAVHLYSPFSDEELKKFSK